LAHFFDEGVDHVVRVRRHDRCMKRFVLAVVLALAFVGGARAADVNVLTAPALEDMSLPFWCDWGYDWNDRCFADDSDRLGLGGAGDKVWRAALRFSSAAVPERATIVTAELSLWYDGTCVAPRRRTRACDGRGYDVEARPIYTARWLGEREVEFGPTVYVATIPTFAAPAWLTFDLTDLVAEWHSAGPANDGVLLKLADGEEDFAVGGPSFPSSTYADASVRPHLTVWYVPP
jgi:opacity protein-like surface antigen